MKLMKPRKNCRECHGCGRSYYADSFDRDNGKPCYLCLMVAKRKRKKLLLPW